MAALRDHGSMIDLNPLVQQRVLCKPPGKSPPEEYAGIWYAITDKVSYLPGVSGKVTYHACFHDLPDGLQTHVYAPLGVDIRERWSVGGNDIGEPQEPPPMGIGAPKEGLYLREDIDLRCNFTLSNFVKKNLKSAHGTLVARLVYLAAQYEGKIQKERLSFGEQTPTSPTTSAPRNSLTHSLSQRQPVYHPSPIAHHTTYQESQKSAGLPYEPQSPNPAITQVSSDPSSGKDPRHTPKSGYASLQDPANGPWAPHDATTNPTGARHQYQTYPGAQEGNDAHAPWGPQSFGASRYSNSSMPGELDSQSPQHAHHATMAQVPQQAPPVPPKLPARNSQRPPYAGAIELEG